MQTFTGTVKEAQPILDYSNGKQTRVQLQPRHQFPSGLSVTMEAAASEQAPLLSSLVSSGLTLGEYDPKTLTFNMVLDISQSAMNPDDKAIEGLPESAYTCCSLLRETTGAQVFVGWWKESV